MERGRKIGDSFLHKNQRLKQEYTDFLSKYESTKRKSPQPVHTNEVRQKLMQSASTRLQIYKHDNQRMKERLSALDTYSSRIELEQAIKSQEQELKQLSRINQRLNKSPPALPLPLQKNFTGEEIKELNYFKREVAGLQAKLEASQRRLGNLEQECQQLVAQQVQLKTKVQSSEPDNSELQKRHSWLEKKREVLKASRQSHSERHRLHVKELEQELKRLDDVSLRLQLENMKKGQQARLFAVEQQRLNTTLNMDAWTPSPDFIYKPTVNKIYST